ncbi:MAG TPA: MBL fold metallo-hydrolase, partial [Asanoa sp.]
MRQPGPPRRARSGDGARRGRRRERERRTRARDARGARRPSGERAHARANGGPALGFVVAAGSTTYFAGDTDHFLGMADIAPSLDLAVLPVGGWGPTLPSGHLDPVRAAPALRLLGARRAIPVHWGGPRIPGLWRIHPDRFATAGTDFQARARMLAPEVDAVVAE